MNTNDVINEAVALYVGYGVCPFPKEDESRLIEKFGREVGSRLAEDARNLLRELDQFKPDWNEHSLVSGAQWACGELKRLHPELDSKAIAALEWIFTWWWK